MAKIKTALISVYNKESVAEFAKSLSEIGIQIISSGGTSRALKKAGIKVTDLSEFTGYPEMMDGRVKTLHPKIHGGILMDRDKESHVKEAEKNGIIPIDLVVANLYPFEETILGEPSLEEAIENIDIGGPTIIRAAAKNFKHVTVVCNPADYGHLLEEIKK